jgi:hypothetical protein
MHTLRESESQELIFTKSEDLKESQSSIRVRHASIDRELQIKAFWKELRFDISEGKSPEGDERR